MICIHMYVHTIAYMNTVGSLCYTTFFFLLPTITKAKTKKNEAILVPLNQHDKATTCTTHISFTLADENYDKYLQGYKRTAHITAMYVYSSCRCIN